mgnify:CR=1 FL=1
MKHLLALLFTLLSFGAPAQTSELCPPELATLPTLAQGRVKPLSVHAAETLRFITGSEGIGELAATLAFCRLSFEGLSLPSGLDPEVKIEHVEVRKLLGISAEQNFMKASELAPRSEELRFAHAGVKENNAYKKELNKVLLRLQTLEKIRAGALWTLPEVEAGKLSWPLLTDFVTEAKITALKSQHADPFRALYEQARREHEQLSGAEHMLEYYYTKARPFVWSLVLSLLALALSFALKNLTVGIVASSVVLLVEIAGMTLRVLISGRAPITNMYETVMFSGAGALALGLVLALAKRERVYLIGGLAYNCLCLMMMKFANNMLDPSISPLVPVLRDNFWLSTHVTTIILSYAALALSWILANVALIRQSFYGAGMSEVRREMEQIYDCMKVGVVLLAAGIILGGVWADYSWGRFWGWDPKETWSLIVLLIYMAILHGRYSNWITPRSFIPLTAGAFLSVMMAWFGVNYILATGLHSYGFSEGGAIFLGAFFAAQLALLALWYLRFFLSKRA